MQALRGNRHVRYFPCIGLVFRIHAVVELLVKDSDCKTTFRARGSLAVSLELPEIAWGLDGGACMLP